MYSLFVNNECLVMLDLKKIYFCPTYFFGDFKRNDRKFSSIMMKATLLVVSFIVPFILGMTKIKIQTTLILSLD